MRKSAAVKLTLVPLLAASAMAYADITDDPPPIVSAPGMTEPVLTPPGMTPPIDQLSCDEDPSWELRPDCREATIEGEGGVVETDVVRGGYGSYFWAGGIGYGG